MESSYYKFDIRWPLLAIALMQLVCVIAVLAGLGIIFYSVKLGTTVTAVSVVLFITTGRALLHSEKYLFRKMGSFPKSARVLFGEIEDPTTANNIKLVAEDIGGLYRDGTVVVLGSLKGELRCEIEHFEVKMHLTGSATGNYLILSFPGRETAFFPKWDGRISEAPSSQVEKVKWASGLIVEMLT